MTFPAIGVITDRKSILIGVSQMKSKQLSAPLTLGIVEAGRRLGLGRDAAYRAVSLGQIPSIMISTRRRVPTAALESLLETGTPSQIPAMKLKQPKISRKSAGGGPKVCRTAAETASVPLHLPVQIELADERVTLTAGERAAARVHGGEIPFAKAKAKARALAQRDGDHANSEVGAT